MNTLIRPEIPSISIKDAKQRLLNNTGVRMICESDGTVEQEAPPAPESWLWRHVNPIVWGIVIAGSLALGAGLVLLASSWLGWGLKG